MDLLDLAETRQQELARLICKGARWDAGAVKFRSSFRWVLDPKRLVLVLGDSATGRWVYEVDLERCSTCAGILDRLAHILGKGWASNEILGDLVRALNDVLRFRPNLCGGGKERGRIDVKAIIASAMKSTERRQRSG